MTAKKKMCHACGKPKDLTDFHRRFGTKDGRQLECIDCRRIKLEKYKGNSEQPLSTRIAKHILESEGIPCITGYQGGQPRIDLLAWGIVPVEAKLASDCKRRKYFSWGLTPRQQLELEGVVLLIAAQQDNSMRFFIVPSDKVFAESKWWGTTRTRIAMTLDSQHANAVNWQRLKKYENEFEVIEQARTKYSEELRESCHAKDFPT